MYFNAIKTGSEHIRSDELNIKDNSIIFTFLENSWSPKNIILFNDEYQHGFFKYFLTKFFILVHNDLTKSKICKRAFNGIKDIYKESKVKIIGMDDFKIVRTFLNLTTDFYFIPKITYSYEFRQKPRNSI